MLAIVWHLISLLIINMMALPKKYEYLLKNKSVTQELALILLSEEINGDLNSLFTLN